MNPPAVPPSKLLIRSEVLAVIDALATLSQASKPDKAKQVKRLQALEHPEAVAQILLKELQRSQPGSKSLQVIGELLMDLGDLATLRDPLWALIEHATVADEIKDTANLVLRHLGDETDPDLYLDYLEDPVGLINRETERMLQVSASNPEALIDFIDFIFSLPESEQANLLQSLQEDYDAQYLLNLYIPILEGCPPEPTRHLLVRQLGQTKHARALAFLEDFVTRVTPDQDELIKLVRKAINELRLAGANRSLEDASLVARHPLTGQSKIHQCFITLPDGIGNQGVIVSRKKPNGDVLMMSVAFNDWHGVIDAFGFYDLPESDFIRIVEKFHEESAKIRVDAAYCHAKLQAAEALNRSQGHRLPYEYSCWKVILDDIAPQQANVTLLAANLVQERWREETANLYQHPEFRTWFMEEEDHPAAHQVLTGLWRRMGQLASQKDPLPSKEAWVRELDAEAETLARVLMQTDWRDTMIRRLSEAAYLLELQEVHTFASLAATAAGNLAQWQPEDRLAGHGFLKAYGRRCIEELLLRLKFIPNTSVVVLPYIDAVLDAWQA